MIIIAASEKGCRLRPLAQSIEAITQPKFTYPKKNLTRLLEPKPSSFPFHSPHQTSIITFLFGSSFQMPPRWEETAKGGGLIPTQLPITFIRHCKKSTGDQRFTSNWSRGEINIWRVCMGGGCINEVKNDPPTNQCLFVSLMRKHKRRQASRGGAPAELLTSANLEVRICAEL